MYLVFYTLFKEFGQEYSNDKAINHTSHNKWKEAALFLTIKRPHFQVHAPA